MQPSDVPYLVRVLLHHMVESGLHVCLHLCDALCGEWLIADRISAYVNPK